MKFLNKIFRSSEKKETVGINDLWFSVPTVSNEFPQTLSSEDDTEDILNIHEDDWRQIEFLNTSALSEAKNEIQHIKAIFDTDSKKGDGYVLFKRCHVRNQIGDPKLAIDFLALKNLLNPTTTNKLSINGSIVRNGFSFTTTSTVYYGLAVNDTVTTLCIAQWSESTIDEILSIVRTLDLIFVNWYQGEIIPKQ
jgi:hypothetical protein